MSQEQDATAFADNPAPRRACVLLLVPFLLLGCGKKSAPPPPVGANPALPPPTVEAGKNFTNEVGMKMVWIKAGTFMMGSPASEEDGTSNENQVEVTLSQPFWMGAHEVTQAQWQPVMGNNPSHFKGENLPVEQVSWAEARAFCGKLTAKERAAGKLPAGHVYNLPSEAQWEYACRAETTSSFHYGDSLSSTQANFTGDYPYGAAEKGPSLGKTVTVGSYAPNAWGLYDMHGNVWEYCADWYGEKLPGGIDPQGPTHGSDRVNRGGGWFDGGTDCRSANRFKFTPVPSTDLGFRVALVQSRP